MICTKCKTPRKDDEFSWRVVGKRRHGICKECHNRYNKALYSKNHTTRREEINSRKHDISLWFREVKKSLSCERCGDSHPACLDFHHLDPSEKDFTISMAGGQGYSKNRILNEISKCIVLCSNCHRKLHFAEK